MPLSIMHHLRGMAVFDEGTVGMVVVRLIQRCHDGELGRFQRLEFKHAAEWQRRANITVHYEDEAWIVFKYLVSMLAEDTQTL